MPIGFLDRDPATKPDAGSELDLSHPYTRGMVGCWLFNEGSGPPRNLVTSSPVTPTGSPGWAPGLRGVARTYDGTSSGDLAGPFPTVLGDFTCLAWFRSSSTATTQRIVDKAYDTGFWIGHEAIAGSDNWGGGVQASSSPYGVFVPLARGEWHQLVSIRSGTAQWVYGDGGKVGASGSISSTALDSTAVRFGYSDTSNGWFSGQIDHILIWDRALSAADVASLYADPFPFLLAPTTRRFFGTAASDTTAPVLTSPVGTQTGATTATIGATTDEGNGTLYGVVTTSSTPPTATQVKAGQNDGGTSAVFAGTASVGGTGARTISATGLTASTGYYAHLVHADAAGNNSNVVSSSQFTTTATPLSAGTASFDSSGPAGGSAFVKMTATDATGGTPTYTYQWQRNTDGGSYSDLSNGSGVSGATTRTLTDGSATSGHLYGYRLAYTDSAGTPATATSGAATAQVYGGGSLAGGSVPFIGMSPFIRGA